MRASNRLPNQYDFVIVGTGADSAGDRLAQLLTRNSNTWVLLIEPNKRQRSSWAFWRRSNQRPNLVIATECQAPKILFHHNTRAVGVEYKTATGEMAQAAAMSEVILCVSPAAAAKLLAASGVEPGAERVALRLVETDVERAAESLIADKNAAALEAFKGLPPKGVDVSAGGGGKCPFR